jgi:hypothetical protein
MKKLVLLIALISARTAFSQDIITKTNGDEIKAKVIEVEAERVKYRKWENTDGPLYNLPKTEIFMIKYSNGEKEIFSAAQAKQPEAAPRNLHSDVCAKYDSLMRLSSSNRTGGIVSCVLGPAFLAAGLVTLLYVPNNTTSTAVAALGYTAGAIQIVGGATLTALGPVFLVKAKKQRQAAQQYKPAVSMRLPQFNYDSQARAASLRLDFVF